MALSNPRQRKIIVLVSCPKDSLPTINGEEPSIELVINYNKTSIINNINEFLIMNQKVSSIVFFSAEYNKSDYLEKFLTRITYTRSTVYSEKCCGVVNEQYFTPSLEHYLESLSYNTCLNKKISLDINGYLKNCPSMSSSFGHVSNSAIRDLLEDIEFTKMFYLKKDDIQVCSTCEFRHVCTDCRAYIEAPSNLNSKPLKCGYDPETQIWSEWSQNPLKFKAIDHYFPNGEF
jgi:SPASM domain peptide maturase of grasp-with-spasm system